MYVIIVLTGVVLLAGVGILLVWKWFNSVECGADIDDDS